MTKTLDKTVNRDTQAKGDPLNAHLISIVEYQSEPDNLRFNQNIVKTLGAEVHKEAQDNMNDRKSDPCASQPEVSLTNQLAALNSLQH